MSESNSIVVRTMWHGSPLSIWEELSLRSFVRFGHEVELYAYEQMNVPKGVQLRDANEVLPEKDIFGYANGLAKGSFMAFSNLFRMLLLYEKGGVWSDLDMLCLKSLSDLPDGVCAGLSRSAVINGAFLKFPPKNHVCEKILNQIATSGKNLFLGETSEVLSRVIGSDQSCFAVMPDYAFYPFSWDEAWKLVDPSAYAECEEKTRESYCVHWWYSAMMNVMGIPRNMLPPKGSFLYEKAVMTLGHSNFFVAPIESVKVWINHFKGNPELNNELNRLREKNQILRNEIEILRQKTESLHRPLTALLKSDIRTILEDVKNILKTIIRRFPYKRW